MTLTSIASLRTLPPRQVLLWALQEKAKREKLRQEHAASSLLPRPRNVDSLILDRDHPLSDFYYQEARYKVAWGGRASAKSWAVAEALIRKASVLPIRVLCTREYQVSIRDSSHRLLLDTINRLGLERWFTITATEIKSRCGAEFIFKGLHNNVQGIRSTEGVDICWVEEAQSVSEPSWRSLLPTIRKPGSEIWVTFNLMDENDATYQRFVATPRRNSIIHKVNFDSNPFFPEVMREEMEEDKRRDFHLYEHIWLGMPLRISDEIVLSGKYTVREFSDDLWRSADRVHYGLDFGFAQDPAALVRFFPLVARDRKRRLYITHEAYGAGIDLDEMPDWMLTVPGVRDWPIKADSSRPETISHLRRQAFNVSAAEKWEGSVKDGIAHLRGYDEIVIHPRCVNVAREARLYRYKVDPKTLDEHGQPTVLPIIVDRHNHTWDGIRYGLDGYIQRSGADGMWSRLAS